MAKKRQKLNDVFETRATNPREVKVGDVVTSALFKKPFWHDVHGLESRLSEELKTITFKKPIAAVYNPLIYADKLHSMYLAKFVTGPKKILFVGMNPGPFGMCQTSVESPANSILNLL